MKYLSLFLIPLVSHANSDSIAPSVIFAEKDGTIAIEAEHFSSQSKTSQRSWQITHKGSSPKGHSSHVKGTSGEAYLKLLPDTRQSLQDLLIEGKNFSRKGGHMAVLSYKIHFKNTGKYYCWVRTFSSNKEDNELHLGINNTWPSSGARLEWKPQNKWSWSSSQRSSTGQYAFGKIWINIRKPGLHTVHFSMREDGAEFDKFILTKKKPNLNSPPKGLGPSPNIKSGTLLKMGTASKTTSLFAAIQAKASIKPIFKAPPREVDSRSREEDGSYLLLATDFPTGGPYLVEQAQRLILDRRKAHSGQTSVIFPYRSRDYRITFMAVGENDGNSHHEIFINKTPVIKFVTPSSKLPLESGPKFHTTSGIVRIKRGDVITVKSTIPTDKGQNHSSARWEGLRFGRVE